MTVLTLALGACAECAGARGAGGTGAERGRPGRRPVRQPGAQHVHVYLVGEQREWLLGRVEPGAVATLRLPDASLASNPGFVRLAVLAGGQATQRAARDHARQADDRAAGVVDPDAAVAVRAGTAHVAGAERGALALHYIRRSLIHGDGRFDATRR